MKKMTYLLCIALFGCGQQGKLYLSDQDLLMHTQDFETKITIEARIKQERQNLAKIKVLQDKRTQMKQKNQSTDAIDLEILEIQYILGQNTLKKQQAGRNQ